MWLLKHYIGDVKEKVYNKQSIYVPVQSKETSLTKKETEDKNKEIAQLRKDILDLQKKVKITKSSTNILHMLIF